MKTFAQHLKYFLICSYTELRDFADQHEVAVSTVLHWANGGAEPAKSVQKLVLQSLEKAKK